MVVNPQSEIRLLSNVPFDSSYKHTILFGSTTAQLQYMLTKVTKQYSRFSYIRHSEGAEHSVKIPELADNIYGCNYMMFQNAGFGTKWFYAFITGIEYVNNDTTRINFVIDQWQTWITEMEIGTCYVEREHVTDDTVGKHTVAEDLPVGGYVCDGGAQHYESGSGVIAQMAFEDDDGGHNQSGVFSGLTLVGAPYSGSGSVADMLKQFADQPEKIGMVTMASGNMTAHNTVQSSSGSFGMSRGYTGFRFQGDSYTPKNNKLYTFPYCFLTVDNYNGNCENYHWEDFDSPSQANFVIHESPIPRPCMECYPVNYKGIQDAQGYGVTYDNFPMCPYIIDTYRAWSSQATPKMLATTGATVAVAVATGGIVAPAGALLGSAVAPQLGTIATSALIGGASNAANYAIDNEYHKIHSTSAGGTIAGSGMNFDQGRVGFRFIAYTIKPEYARIIDDYFNRFGYKVMRYKKPNLDTRTTFNYVKTVEAIVDGNIPEDAIDTIESSLNRGITLWHTVAVGNYSVKNDNVGDKKVSTRVNPEKG